MATNSLIWLSTIRTGFERARWAASAALADCGFFVIGSNLAVGDEARGGAQNIAARAERFQCAVGILNQGGKPRARAVAAEDRNERRLAGGVVLAGALAERCRVAFGVEKIVRDLERLA